MVVKEKKQLKVIWMRYGGGLCPDGNRNKKKRKQNPAPHNSWELQLILSVSAGAKRSCLCREKKCSIVKKNNLTFLFDKNICGKL